MTPVPVPPQRQLPAQTHGNQLRQRIVCTTAQPGLPAFIGQPRRPAVDVQQQRVGIGFDAVGIGQPQLGKRRQNQGLRIIGQFAEGLIQPRLAHQNGNATVGADLLHPAQVQRFMCAVLRLLAERCTELADLMGDFIPPRHLMLAVTGAVEPIGYVMPVGFAGRLLQHLQQRLNVFRHPGLRRRLQQMLRADAAALP